MAWYDEAVFYHIYPLGLLGAPKENKYDGITHRLRELFPWVEHIKEIGCNAIYIGPLFESVGHGYETTDYKKLEHEGMKKSIDDFNEKGLKEQAAILEAHRMIGSMPKDALVSELEANL